MLDFIGMVITAALMVLIVNALTTFMDVSRVAKIVLAAVIGVWIGLAVAAAGAGWLPISRPVPVVGLFVVVPLLATALATAWPAARKAMLSIPMPVMAHSISCASSPCCFSCWRPMGGSPARSRTAPPGATSSRASSPGLCCGS
jgi:hypothetical protein